MPPQNKEVALLVAAADTGPASSTGPVQTRAGTATTYSATAHAVTAECAAVHFGTSSHATGICFLDHMVDQLTSHAQLGVTLRVSINGVPHRPHVDYARGSLTDRPHDADIFAACGAALGRALRGLVDAVDGGAGAAGAAAVFCCPLDEAFAEARLELFPAASGARAAAACALAPYGTMPAQGRRWIGCYRCALTPVFFERLVETLGCSLRLRKVRGHNAHHIVESSFKAFARVFRACLDNADVGGEHGCVMATEEVSRLEARRLADGQARAAADGGAASAAHRTGSRSRSTKETTIDVTVDLDAPAPAALGDALSTGVELMDRVLGELRRAAGFRFAVHCDGDTYIDDHHTVEDVAITLGQCLNAALGDKAGLARMGCAEARSGAVAVRCVLDLSNRPFFAWDLPLDEEYVGGDAEARAAMGRGGGADAALCGAALTCEMLQHVFESLTIEARATVHLELLRKEEYAAAVGHTKDLAIASARAYGAALAECVRVDPRRAGKVASSKGTLSV